MSETNYLSLIRISNLIDSKENVDCDIQASLSILQNPLNIHNTHTHMHIILYSLIR